MYLYSKFRFGRLWTWASLIGSLAILLSMAVYLDRVRTPDFLLEKGRLREHPIWLTAFYFHIAAAAVCLAVGPALMVVRLIRIKRLHQVLGYVYLNAVLWVAAPTGLLISPTAKFGWMSATGFVVTSVLWWWTTWLGWVGIQQGDTGKHVRWLVRSYSLALGAVWFRVSFVALKIPFLSISEATAYIASVWISLLVSLAVCEAALIRLFSAALVGTDWLSLFYPAKASGFPLLEE